MELLKNSVYERRIVCQPAVEDQEAGAIAEDELKKAYSIHNL